MSRLTRLVPALLLALAPLGASACVATAAWYPPRPMVDRDDRAFYNRGFADGRVAGVDDARRGRSYDARRHPQYRQVRRGDDPGDVRAYRSGFEAGYDNGYRRDAWSGGGPRRDRDDDDRGRAITPGDIGYRDGFDAGRRAFTRRSRPDPIRERLYREGDHGYDRRFGPLDTYKREYRDAFRRGYTEGYR